MRSFLDHRQTQVLASVTFLPEAASGRLFTDGYMCVFRQQGSEEGAGFVVCTFPQREAVPPGERVSVTFRFLAGHARPDLIAPDTAFELREGGRPVARGIVTALIPPPIHEFHGMALGTLRPVAREVTPRPPRPQRPASGRPCPFTGEQLALLALPAADLPGLHPFHADARSGPECEELLFAGDDEPFGACAVYRTIWAVSEESLRSDERHFELLMAFPSAAQAAAAFSRMRRYADRAGTRGDEEFKHYSLLDPPAVGEESLAAIQVTVSAAIDRDGTRSEDPARCSYDIGFRRGPVFGLLSDAFLYHNGERVFEDSLELARRLDARISAGLA